jgi:hypothetical protein
MPRPRKPTELHVLEGTLRSRHKDREGEPIVLMPLGPPPKCFQPEARIIWHELVDSIPPGVVTKSDRYIVELAVRLVIQMRHSKMGLTPALASQLRACLASLGLTPADRSRVTAPPAIEASAVDRFFPEP